MPTPDDEAGFLPGAHPIDGYGAGGFRFGEMSHRGSILALPSGIYAWPVSEPTALVIDAFARVLAEVKAGRGTASAIEHLIIGTGANMLPLFDLCAALRRAGLRVEPMATAAAARTYSILLGEQRRVAAALIAVS